MIEKRRLASSFVFAASRFPCFSCAFQELRLIETESKNCVGMAILPGALPLAMNAADRMGKTSIHETPAQVRMNHILSVNSCASVNLFCALRCDLNHAAWVSSSAI